MCMLLSAKYERTREGPPTASVNAPANQRVIASRGASSGSEFRAVVNWGDELMRLVKAAGVSAQTISVAAFSSGT
jgi:hypothetical protein